MKQNKELTEQFLHQAKIRGIEAESIRVLRSNAFYVGNSHVLLRTASDLGHRYFFGLNYVNAEEIYNLKNSFVAFICGQIDKTVFLPTDVLMSRLPQISHDRNGEYKINFTRDLSLALSGRGNRLDCSQYLNNWDCLQVKTTPTDVNTEESIHNVIQGRLLEIGNMRGYLTYSPDKSRTFNRVKLGEIATLDECPRLQFSDHELLRKIDVTWFRKLSNGYYPECAFEVEISTGVWSGFGRLATLREYATRMYIITFDSKKFLQVSGTFPELSERYTNLIPDQVGLLHSAEKRLIKMREKFSL